MHLDSQHAASRGPATFVGETVCATCHPREAAAWRGSDHQRAMQPAATETVLGDFANATFTYAGITSTFFERDGKHMVRTDGPDGALHEYEITHTFGVAPLQQYLVAFPDGRHQALEIAWDSRPSRAGGQRWFHLYPDEAITHGDPLHWTGIAENWNAMCADCHSTNVRKAWSAQTQRYATHFAEMSVACEACHGPGSQHVAWAKQPQRGADNGLAIALDERAGVYWTRDATNKPARNRPRTSEREIEMCARCHSRRGLLHEDVVHGQPVSDDYRVALLDDELYYPDGQIKGEVYEYGSFLQSRMFAEGVTCSDCHDPHSQKLRAPDDGVCLQCHAASYADAKHHFHTQGSAGARCVSCHMPATTYMVIDERRDHSLRVPRPDLSVKLGVPNPCNGCHRDRSATWAAATVERWYGHTPAGLQQFAETLSASTRGEPGATQRLAQLAADDSQPAIARATAIDRLRELTPAAYGALRDGLGDASPLVRHASVHALAALEPRSRAGIASLVADPVRSVRFEAAAALAGVPDEQIAPELHALRARATAEYIAAQELNGDRPEGNMGLAALYAAEQDAARAEASLQRALAIDPAYVPAHVNLADLYRATGRDADAEHQLRGALVRVPHHPALLHALGLALVRQHRLTEALEPLRDAARVDRDNPRLGYVYAVALHDAGDRNASVRELESVLERHPYDRDSLTAIIAFLREAGDARRAQTFAARLEAQP